ncbi:hypothetical protein JTB14_037074 [Gonioctena quinquepunctata]|nr:hypothetical protein JTB14_037074 [Gonioctena quinquepunctata]
MKYECIKKDMKKKCADNKTYLRGSGEGHHVPPHHPPTEEEKQLYETISMSIHGLKNPSDSDATEWVQSDMTISDKLAIFDELAEEAIIETNWTAFNCKMLQTPLYHALIVESDHLYPFPLNQEKIESSTVPEGKKWSTISARQHKYLLNLLCSHLFPP